MARPKNPEWPENLLAALEMPPQPHPEDFDASLAYALAELSRRAPRGCDCLIKYYKDGWTFADIGRAHGITGTRAAQLITNMTHLLKRPKYSLYISEGVIAVCRAQTDQTYSEAWQTGYNAGYKAGLEGFVNKLSEADEEVQDMPIEQLELGLRAFNILARAGKCTVRDVLAMDFDQLRRLRGMGEKTYQDIISTLEGHGFDCARLRPKVAIP